MCALYVSSRIVPDVNRILKAKSCFGLKTIHVIKRHKSYGIWSVLTWFLLCTVISRGLSSLLHFHLTSQLHMTAFIRMRTDDIAYAVYRSQSIFVISFLIVFSSVLPKKFSRKHHVDIANAILEFWMRSLLLLSIFLTNRHSCRTGIAIRMQQRE